MQLLNQKISIDSFFTRFRNSYNNILMLDYDGTLSPFTTERENAFPYEGVPERLEKIMNLTTSKVIIISGRDIKMLKKLLPFKKYPELYGSHGGEFFSEQEGYKLLVEDKVKKLITDTQKWTIENSYEKQFELKPLSCAFHWRGKSDDEIAEFKKSIESKWSSEIQSYQMEMHYFDGGIEFKLKSVNKGNAVKKVLEQSDVSNSAIAYLGDDLTDEDAFEALGDSGLKILVNNNIRNTFADIRINPPEELYDFLDRWYEAARKYQS